MRVTCPNCDQRVLLDAAKLSDAPLQTICARCGVPYRISLLCEKATLNAATAPAALASAPRDTAQHTSASHHRADEDVLALPHADSHADHAAEPTCVVLDLGDAHEALRRSRTRTLSEDKYHLGARLLNVSPLRLLLLGIAFVALVGFCDMLLAPSEHAGDDVIAAALQNQATNRAPSRSPRRDTNADDTHDDDARDADSETTARATGEPAATKPAPVSDPATHAADSDAPAASTPTASAPTVPAPNASASSASASNVEPAPTAFAVSYANARQELPAETASGEQPATKVTLQLASYRVEDEAQKLAASLQAAGFESRIVTEQHSKRPWYCVQTRMFDTRGEAEQYLTQLRAKHLASSYTLREVE